MDPVQFRRGREDPSGVSPPDQPTLELLYRRHFAWLLQAVRKRFGVDQAEDLVHDVYVRVASYASGEVRNPRALLLLIASRAAIDRARRDRARPLVSSASQVELASEAQQAEALALKQVVLALPPKLSEVFLLSRFGGLSYEEISQHCGISVKTVEWRMSKALKLCARKLRG